MIHVPQNPYRVPKDKDLPKVRKILESLRESPWQTKNELAVVIGSNPKTVARLIEEDDRLSNLRSEAIKGSKGPTAIRYALAERSYNACTQTHQGIQ